MNATVILAKCKNSKESFGIRAEQQNNTWVFTWAFKISEKVAANEGYNTTNVSGVISLDDDYPGCPHCKATGFSQCGKCKKTACFGGNAEKVTCPHCGYTDNTRSAESFDDIEGGAF